MSGVGITPFMGSTDVKTCLDLQTLVPVTQKEGLRGLIVGLAYWNRLISVCPEISQWVEKLDPNYIGIG